MTEQSNIRKLLCSPDLGLLPHIERCLNDWLGTLTGEGNIFQLDPYDLELGNCYTHRSTNGQKPLVTQSVSLKFMLTGIVEDKLKLLLFASELQNLIDIKIIDWSAMERRQYDIHGIPLKQPVTKIDGKICYELATDPSNTCYITLHRQFDLAYAANF
jgi:hypothetical protein